MSDDEARPGEGRRWLKRLGIGLLVVVGVLALVVWGGRAHFRRVGTERLNAATAKLDAEEPGWRLDAILARRQQQAPPPNKNAADLILTIGEPLTAVANKKWSMWQSAEAFQDRERSNHRLPPEWVVHLDEMRDDTARLRERARTLRNYSAGYYPLTIGENPFAALLPHVDKVRAVAALLEYDALLAAVDNDTDGAFRSAHAALCVARSFGDEPILISQLVRIACANIATQAAFQALAWGEAKQGLPEFQAALAAEADEPWFVNALRGERGSLDRIFTGLASGRLSMDDLAALGIDNPGTLDRAGFRLYKAFIPEDHAAALRILGEYIAAAKLPHHEQPAAFAKIKLPPRPPDDFRYIGTNLLLPAVEKVAEVGLRSRAQLLTAACLLACERFRLANGRWPESLAEIPKDILPAVPLDPYDGNPLRFERLKDGVTVYSVGPRPRPQTYRLTEMGPFTDRGIGWKLWDVDQRGLPPKPKPVEPGPGGDDEPIPPPREVIR